MTLKTEELYRILSMQWPDFCDAVMTLSIDDLMKMIEIEKSRERPRRTYLKRMVTRYSRLLADATQQELEHGD